MIYDKLIGVRMIAPVYGLVFLQSFFHDLDAVTHSNHSVFGTQMLIEWEQEHCTKKAISKYSRFLLRKIHVQIGIDWLAGEAII